MVMFGDGGATLAAERLSHWRAATEPLGAVLVAPRRMPDLSGLAGIHAHAILAGAADASPDPDALRAHADSASVPLGITVIDDLTEFLQAEADWLAGRPVPHPGLCAALADAVSDLLRPRWERDARPPGTAIGTA